MRNVLLKSLCCLSTAVLFQTGAWAQIKGPSSSQTPYVLPVKPGVKTTSVLTVQDVIGGYKMCGLPDGLGAFDNGNGTFTVLMNHEIGNTSGVVRAHGSTGAFVSKWVINKSGFSVVSGSDLIQNAKLWNGSGYTTYNAANPSNLARFGRFCSADLPAVSAFYNSVTGMGTQERIFMNGEETGAEGRGFGHIATGPNAGTTYELPYLGKFSYENAVANPATGDKTVVAGLDDATPGQVYFYIGTKTNSGTEIEKAGLSNGILYGPAVNGMLIESSASFPAPGTPFTMINLGDVHNLSGATLQTNSNTAGVTQFLRPEDGAWDPLHPEDFYFVTTNGFTSPSRLWKMHFSNISDLTLGGTITAVLDGTEGQRMLDNMGIDKWGQIFLQEDVGNQQHNGKIWQYTIATDSLLLLAKHDTARFGDINIPATAPFSQDEEASGIIDMQEILGAGMFLITDQAHYPIPSDPEVVEGGQLLVLFNPVKRPFYQDYDRDTYGNNSVSVMAFNAPAGYTDRGNDCNDKKSSVYPGATEIGDNLDNNCNGQIDEGLDLTTFYHDYDRDGYGNSNAIVMASKSPGAGYVTAGGDCSDKKNWINPGAPEVLNGIDDNCNGTIDEGLSGISAPSETVEEALSAARIKVSATPNPSNNLFNLYIRSKNDKPVDLQVTNLLGCVVERRLNIAPNATLQIGHSYLSGMYFVEVRQGTEREIIKLVRE